VTHTGCLLATIDAEIGEIGPGPKGCGEKSDHTSCSPSTVDPPQPSVSASHPSDQDLSPGSPASSGPIFARNAIHLNSVSRP